MLYIKLEPGLCGYFAVSCTNIKWSYMLRFFINGHWFPCTTVLSLSDRLVAKAFATGLLKMRVRLMEQQSLGAKASVRFGSRINGAQFRP